MKFTILVDPSMVNMTIKTYFVSSMPSTIEEDYLKKLSIYCMTLYGHVLPQDPLHRRFKKFTNLAHLPSLTLLYINFVMDL